jgi:hypothetical protein
MGPSETKGTHLITSDLAGMHAIPGRPNETLHPSTRPLRFQLALWVWFGGPPESLQACEDKWSVFKCEKQVAKGKCWRPNVKQNCAKTCEICKASMLQMKLQTNVLKDDCAARASVLQWMSGQDGHRNLSAKCRRSCCCVCL